MVFYCGLWRLIEIYCYSLLLICDLFVVYESNNYEICKIGTTWCFIAVYEDWLKFIVTHCYLFVVCLWFMNPITMESVKSENMVVSWWFIAVYEDWLKFIVSHCYLFVICLLFMNPITMESVKSKIIWWFHGDLLRFMKIDWDLSLLMATYLWFVCGLWVQQLWNL